MAEKKYAAADVRYSEYWCRPEFGVDPADPPEKTQGLLWQEEDGTYGTMFPLPVSDTKEGGYQEEKLIRYGADPYALLLGLAEEISEKTGIPLRKDRKYPEIFEYLGWCTWDAMEIWVSESGVLDKCAEFKEKSVPVRWAILDDMWADVSWQKKLPPFTAHEISFGVMHASKLKDFAADPERFPDGLSGLVRKMKEYGLSVGAWHTVQGYWSGIEKNGPAYEKAKEFLVENEKGQFVPDLRDPEKAYGFYHLLHDMLKEAGIDFVKIDNQSCVEQCYAGLMDTVQAAKNLNAAIDRSVSEHFDGALINCMGMGLKNMLARPSSCISRCSDDFQPENRAWFAKHIKQCAWNGLFQGQFYVNDWDMWWTDDAQAVKNSVLRAISGGPIYVSDKVGRTNPEILDPLVLDDGRILRCDDAAVPVKDCLLTDPVTGGKAFAVFNHADEVTYIAAFNLSEDGQSVRGTICPADYGYTGRVALYKSFKERAEMHQASDMFEYTLESPDDFELFVLAPLTEKPVLHGVFSKFIGRRAVRMTGPDTVWSEVDDVLYYSSRGDWQMQEVHKGENRLWIV